MRPLRLEICTNLCNFSYLNSITINMLPRNTQLCTTENLRSFITLVSQELQWLGAINVLARFGEQPIGPVLGPLFRDGTIRRCTRLEVMRIRDHDLEETFRKYTPKEKEFVRAKMRKWQNQGKIDESLDSELRFTAARMLKCVFANRNFAQAIREFRRDSVLGVTDVGGSPGKVNTNVGIEGSEADKETAQDNTEGS